MKTSWWRCERKTSGDLTPELWSPLGNFNLSGGAGVLVCVRCYFILPAGDSELCRVVLNHVADCRRGESHQSCRGEVWSSRMINSNMKASARCCDSDPPITDSLSCWLQLFHCARLVSSPFYNPVFSISIPSVIPFLSSPPHFLFKPPELAIDCWR